MTKCIWFVVAFIIIISPSILAETKRVIIIKADGLPYELTDRLVQEKNPRTGKSRLPWIDQLFYKQGAQLRNFYTRGLSVSAPSWALLETGMHAQIKGNIEFDRYTLQTYDYLNFVAYYLNSVHSHGANSQAVEVLDEIGIPLIADAFTEREKFTGFEFLQRGVPWKRLRQSFSNRFTSRSLRELFDEWVIGFEMQSMIGEQIERDLIKALADPKVKYLVYFTADIDHLLHTNRAFSVHREALQKLDALIGRLWTSVQRSPLASETTLVLISDHGMNTDEKIYSQGYNLTSLLMTAEGGGHHVATRRPLLANYSFKGLNPFSGYVVTPSSESLYLSGQSKKYPTALLDPDGNERASLYLRDSSMNMLHSLLQQMKRPDLRPEFHRAAVKSFFTIVEEQRPRWETTLDQLQKELNVLRQSSTQLKKYERDISLYDKYIATLNRLLNLKPESFTPSRLRIEDIIPLQAIGENNNIYKLQNYVIGLSEKGLTLNSKGEIDLIHSFKRVNYFSLLRSLKTRNNVQSAVSNLPVDFIATRVPRESLSRILHIDDMPDQDAVWLYSTPEKQALLLFRKRNNGELAIRYLPVSELKQSSDGAIIFARASWQIDLPLKLWEDENLQVIGDNRISWLDQWHSELEWLRASHKTNYSNAIISLYEFFARHNAWDENKEATPSDKQLHDRFIQRRRRLVEPDMLILANYHWNFNSFDFNPGGNHGSFFRVSTQSILMFTGGVNTGLPRGLAIDEPYDSLSYAPTILTMMGLMTEGNPSSTLKTRGFRNFPGRVINELFK